MKKIDQLWKIGLKNGFRVIRWTPDGNVDYEWAREISNSRFDQSPQAIAFPKTAKHVRDCVVFCREMGVPFRVRSGGHQHEGMSSLDDGVMIRLSELNAIEYKDEDRAWIGVGKPLKEVYDELELRGKTIPGGGCWSVNVGGLALGGGWGTSARPMGLTCDNFEAVEIVTGEGEILIVDEKNHEDLFWALRGGGGGNFGIVTKFLFRLSTIGPVVSSLFLQWKEPTTGSDEEKKEYLAKIVEDYLQAQARWSRNLTTVLGLRVKHKFMPDGKYYPLGLAGKFYGSLEKLEEILRPFMDRHPFDDGPHFRETHYPTAPETPRLTDAGDSTAPGQPDPQESPFALSDLINEVVDSIHSWPSMEAFPELPPAASATEPYPQDAPPSTTCLAPWPHKISSGFLRGRDAYSDLARKGVGILLDTNKAMPENAARLYMVLHRMPGKEAGIAPRETAFYWRHHDFLLQFQAWWAPPCTTATDTEGEKAYAWDVEKYLCWIRESRKKLAPELVGAFINFIDRDLSLRDYYGANLERLIEVKNRYDRHNLFRFPMSIPVDTSDLEKEAAATLAPSGYQVVTREDSRYENSREISNAYFDLKPMAIAYPRTAEHVAHSIHYCREKNLKLRICSGGHQHEGMCSGDGALMVRLSEISFIEKVPEQENQYWIGTGARLVDVYRELQKRRKTLAGGGCKSVNIGGLTLGGGWGLSARRFGLAIDNVLAVEVVLANGKIVKATEKNKYKDLFWALLGGGGGNFGIATRFLFKVHDIAPNLSKYRLYWNARGKQREEIIRKWLKFQRKDQSEKTTSYLVLYADRPESQHQSLTTYAGGASYRRLGALKEEVEKLTTGLPEVSQSKYSTLFEQDTGKSRSADVLGLSAEAGSMADFFNYAQQPPDFFEALRAESQTPSRTGGQGRPPECQAEVPKDNCLGSHPHKVTSAFPKGGSEDDEVAFAKAVSRFLQGNPLDPYVKATIALYSLGGAVAKRKPEDTAFYFREKAVVLQIEAWWSYPATEPEGCGCRRRKSWQEPYIEWVRSFRAALAAEGLIDGAFINFVDKDLEKRNRTVQDRRKLLRHYYGKNLDRLMRAKKKWDPEDFFHFEMSIPLPDP